MRRKQVASGSVGDLRDGADGVMATPRRRQVIKAGSASCPAVALTYDLCPVRTASGFDRELIDFLIANKDSGHIFHVRPMDGQT